jgi:HK97 gp10 family phage protein
MARAVARIDGLEELRRALVATPKKTRAALRDMLHESADAVAASAKRNAPRDRGDLASAITVLGRGLTWRAGIERGSTGGRRGHRTHVDPSIYGQFVEFGTSRTTAQPFMKPAAEGETNRLPGRLRVLARVIEAEAESA